MMDEYLMIVAHARRCAGTLEIDRLGTDGSVQAHCPTCDWWDDWFVGPEPTEPN